VQQESAIDRTGWVDVREKGGGPHGRVVRPKIYLISLLDEVTE
jgi:hypothetical protein